MINLAPIITYTSTLQDVHTATALHVLRKEGNSFNYMIISMSITNSKLKFCLKTHTKPLVKVTIDEQYSH